MYEATGAAKRDNEATVERRAGLCDGRGKNIWSMRSQEKKRGLWGHRRRTVKWNYMKNKTCSMGSKEKDLLVYL